MRTSAEWARAQFAGAHVARLATADVDARPHVVPIVFAMTAETLYTAVDAKPKSGGTLRRIRNLSANPSVSVLVDHYDDDWQQLWWVRADGLARVLEADESEAAVAIAVLTQRYPIYRTERPPGPVVAIDVERWSGWRAS